jgi:hypothetical protein
VPFVIEATLVICAASLSNTPLRINGFTAYVVSYKKHDVAVFEPI